MKLGQIIKLFLIILITALSSPFSRLESLETEKTSNKLEARLLPEAQTIQKGKSIWVAIDLQMPPDWHVYWKNPGDAGMPVRIQWTLPPGFEAGPVQWPVPQKFTVAGMQGFGYHKQATLLCQITAPSSLTLNESYPLSAEVEWLLCSEGSCKPGKASLSLTLSHSNEVQLNQEHIPLFKEARARLPIPATQLASNLQEGRIELDIPTVLTGPSGFDSVSFFPEEAGLIDVRDEPIIAMSDDGSQRYRISLKGSDTVGLQGKMLKGVLVLHDRTEPESPRAYEVSLPVSASKVSPEYVGLSSHFLLALLGALIGGLILNLMPCVLPVMSLKILGFIKSAKHGSKTRIYHSLAFCGGILASFWCLASLMLFLRTSGALVGWGFQLQSPLFVSLLASLFFLFSLNLFGVFEWGLKLSSWAGEKELEHKKESQGIAGSFWSGVLATAVATPCTGPFLGSAIGFAMTLSPILSLLIFTALAIGMSIPYLLCAFFPSILGYLPKPGHWMETFKSCVGFTMLATVLWLLWVFEAQTNGIALFSLLIVFFFLALGSWIYGQTLQSLLGRKLRYSLHLVTCLCLVLAGATFYSSMPLWYSSSAGHSDVAWERWEPFSAERIAALQKEGTPVLVDFTAKWCLICQANHLVLSSDRVTQALDTAGVVCMKADWTRNDPQITEALAKFGRSSVPLYVLYGMDPSGEPQILPQILTPDIISSYLQTITATAD